MRLGRDKIVSSGHWTYLQVSHPVSVDGTLRPDRMYGFVTHTHTYLHTALYNKYVYRRLPNRGVLGNRYVRTSIRTISDHPRSSNVFPLTFAIHTRAGADKYVSASSVRRMQHVRGVFVLLRSGP